MGRSGISVASWAGQLLKSLRPRRSTIFCELPITTFRQVTSSSNRRVSLEEMQSRFGEESIWVYNLIRVGPPLTSLHHELTRRA